MIHWCLCELKFQEKLGLCILICVIKECVCSDAHIKEAKCSRCRGGERGVRGGGSVGAIRAVQRAARQRSSEESLPRVRPA